MTENNPFKGKKHSEATKIIMAEKARLRTGEKANNWKGGMSPLRVAIKKTFEYRQWRSDIFGRDNWTCQDCNKKSRKIEAHHIIYLAIIIKEYGLKNIIEARECEKLWDINNGVTLCKECHKKRHKL
jgi:5-methylcytosine-specific restriction endonuclease McrA